MVFRTKRYIFFLILFTMASAKDESSDSDDDALTQALFLVNVLKSGNLLDYAKVLRAGAGIPETTENPSTCPLTTNNASDVPDTTPALTKNVLEINITNPPLLSSTSPLPLPNPSSSVSTTEDTWLTYPAPLPEKSAEQLTYNEDYPLYDMPIRRRNKNNMIPSRKFRKFRRMMPLEYFYYDIPVNRRAFQPRRRGSFRNFRRMGSDDTDFNLTAQISTVIPTTVSTTSTLPTTETTPSPSPTTMFTTRRSKASERAQSTQRKKVAPKIRTTTRDKTESPTIDNAMYPQVARELLNELNGGGLTMEPPTAKPVRFRPALRSKLKTRSNGESMVKQQSDIIKAFNAFKRRSTLRIHMDRSTRLLIPLPENNAYCFMNPKSPLCRTNI